MKQLAVLTLTASYALAQPSVSIIDSHHSYSGSRVFNNPLTVDSITFNGSAGLQPARHTERITYSAFYSVLYGLTSRTTRFYWPGTSAGGPANILETLCEKRAGATTCSDTWFYNSWTQPSYAYSIGWAKWSYSFTDISDPSYPVTKSLYYSSTQKLTVSPNNGNWRVRLRLSTWHYQPSNMTGSQTTGNPSSGSLTIGGNTWSCDANGDVTYVLPTSGERWVEVNHSQSQNFTYHISIISVTPR